MHGEGTAAGALQGVYSTQVRLHKGAAPSLTSHQLRALHHVGMGVVNGDLKAWKEKTMKASEPHGPP